MRRKTTTPLLLILSFLVTGCCLISPAPNAVATPAGSSEGVSSLLSQVKTEAIALEQDSDELAVWTQAKKLSWQSHATKLSTIKEHRNFWEIMNGQDGLAKLSDETGGECYYLGTQNPVSFKPYLDDLQTTLDNQFLLEFDAIRGEKSGPQYVTLSTGVAGVELDAADAVWVEAK
ncbi:MAG: hypothetical protein ABSF71_27760 [Terriglobia bacterium]